MPGIELATILNRSLHQLLGVYFKVRMVASTLSSPNDYRLPQSHQCLQNDEKDKTNPKTGNWAKWVGVEPVRSYLRSRQQQLKLHLKDLSTFVELSLLVPTWRSFAPHCAVLAYSHWRTSKPSNAIQKESYLIGPFRVKSIFGSPDAGSLFFLSWCISALPLNAVQVHPFSPQQLPHRLRRDVWPTRQFKSVSRVSPGS